ncbi:MAG: tyrosine-type recombinase/integrase [Solirubrobacteraceae bacterium]
MEWATAGLESITLHECRHTYASFLMAAGYTLRELMEYINHSSLQATECYVKLLPPLAETDPVLEQAARLDPLNVALDAIHLATAINLHAAGDIAAVLTYDSQLQAGRQHHGIAIEAPTP